MADDEGLVYKSDKELFGGARMTVLNVRVLTCHSDDQHIFFGFASEHVLIVRVARYRLRGKIERKEEQGQVDQTEQPQDELDEYLRMFFKEADVDESGFLSKKELLDSKKDLKRGLFALGADVTNEDINKAISNMEDFDQDDDQQISEDEYVKLTRDIYGKVDQDELRAGKEEAVNTIFSAYDVDGNGYISKDELRQFLGQNGDDPLSPEECEELMAEIMTADTDGDGNITKQELHDYFCKEGPTED